MTGVSRSADRLRSDGAGAPASSIRAAVVDALRGRDEPTTLARLADEIDGLAVSDDAAVAAVGPEAGPTGREPSGGGAAADGRQRVQRLYLALARRHVPLLEARGVVAYDEESGEVRLAAADPPDGDPLDSGPSGPLLEED